METTQQLESEPKSSQPIRQHSRPPAGWPVIDGRVASGIASGDIAVLECREHKGKEGTIYGLHLSFGGDRKIWCRTDRRIYFEAAKEAMEKSRRINAQVSLDERTGKVSLYSMYLGRKDVPDSLLSRCPSCGDDLIARRVPETDELYRVHCQPCGIKDEYQVYGNLAAERR